MWRLAIPLARPGIVSAGIFAFTLSWNEVIYALTLVTASSERTIPVGVLVQLTRADFYFWPLGWRARWPARPRSR